MSTNESAPRRSDATKAAILAAAREHFAEHGYQAATIREIAATAQIDPAMVMRYFGNKAKLFAAAAEFDLRLPDLRAHPKDQVGAVLIEHFLERWEGDDSLKAMLRTAVTDTAVRARLLETFSTQLVPVIAALTGGSRRVVAERSGLVATQILGLALCRYVLELHSVVSLGHDQMVKRIGPTIQAYLFDD